MTYSEIAVALGISPDSARNLVRRKHWHRRPGNDGLARIDVPIEHLENAASFAGLPDADSTGGHIRPPVSGAAEGAASNLALSVLQQHVGRCEAEIDALKQQLESARRRASERDIAAAELATFSVVLAELRSERKYWRDQAERLSLALASPPQRSRWPWLSRRFRNGLLKVGDTAEGDPKTRSAREAAADAGLLPSAISTIPAAENPELVSTKPRPATTSLLDKGGPPITPSDLERALEKLSREIDDAQAAGVPAGGLSCGPIEAVCNESGGAP